MALDMYLYTKDKSSTSKNSEFEEIHCWRMFHALHNWFVNNIQAGIDDCKHHLFTEEKLNSLISTLRVINDSKLEDVAKANLPTVEGVYFGSEDYDENYFEEVKEALEVLTDIKNKVNLNECDLYYCSWW